jgi:hypothetical protein
MGGDGENRGNGRDHVQVVGDVAWFKDPDGNTLSLAQL